MAQTHGYAMILSCTNGLAEKEKSLVEMLLEKGVDGLIVAPADPEANREYYTLLLSQGVKLVFVDREVAGLNIDVVSTDNSMGGYLAARHLVERGRKRFVFVSTTSRDRRSTSVRERLAGAASAISEAGFPAAHVVGPDCPDLPVDEEFAYQAFRSYLKRKHSPFDAVFAVHDGLAYGAIRALSEVRLSVPNEVAVAGFDDQDPSAFFQPPLTTVRQPVNEIGGEAIRLLLNRFSEKNGIGTRHRVALQPKLIVRGST
jgi:LacI family transcriptional regulator